MDRYELVGPNEYVYELNVYVPKQAPPPGGFSVYYVLDGSMYGLYVSEMIRNQIRNSPKTGVDAAIVVAICHQETDYAAARFRDFTAPAEAYHLPERLQHVKDREYGGAALLTSFLHEQLIPFIDRHYPTNHGLRALVGHSLSGYYVLWSMITEHSRFQVHAAISPSIWWNNYELLALAEQVMPQWIDVRPHSSCFIAVGELEGFMVDDAKNMENIINPAWTNLLSKVVSDENHASVMPTVLSAVLRFSTKQFQQNN